MPYIVQCSHTHYASSWRQQLLCDPLDHRSLQGECENQECSSVAESAIDLHRKQLSTTNLDAWPIFMKIDSSSMYHTRSYVHISKDDCSSLVSNLEQDL